MQKGIRYRMKSHKNTGEKRVFHAVIKYFQKGCWSLLDQLQNVSKYPLEQIACEICELHAKQITLAI